MNQHLQALYNFFQESADLNADEKAALLKTVRDVDKELEITLFKLDRTEKVKRTTAILLEETIEELEQKRKAVEAQNRELEIESALERVRSVAMGMKQPTDMLDICHIISDQLQLLRIADIRNVQTAIIDAGKSTYNNYQYFTTYQKGILEVTEYNKHPKVLELVEQMQQSPDAFFSGDFKGKELDVWRQYRKDDNQFPDPILDEAKAVFFYFYSIGHGGLGISTYTPLTEEDVTIFKRFRNVFDLAYRRFIDIEQAEGQAREAQIEAALERVRTKAMAMHKSEDLNPAVATVFEELEKLSPGMSRCGIGILDKEKRSANTWITSITEEGTTVQISGDEPIDIHPLLQGAFNAWLKQVDFSYVLRGKDMTQYYKTSGTGNVRLPESQLIFNEDELKQQYFYFASFQSGGLFAFRENDFPEEVKTVMKRFAGVFNLTYQRFLDLQKAEAQAREATIEASLEKVRGKAMAMHNSKDLSSTASMVFTELRKLGIDPIRCGVGLLTKENRKVMVYATSKSEQGDTLSLSGWAMLENHPMLATQYDSWVRQEDYFPVLKKEDVLDYHEHLKPYFRLPEGTIEFDQYGFFLPFSEGFLYGWTEKSYSETEIKILNRFKAILDLTFRRYFELQKSEANARDAIRQASLDRVRAETASMRTIADLERITPLIWNELSILDVPFTRCGVFIMYDEQEQIHTFLSTPDGRAIAAFQLPYHTPGTTAYVLEHWRKKEMYKDHWDEAAFKAWTKTLVEQGAIPSSATYLTEKPPTNLHLHFLPFLQGMLYVGSETPLSEEELRSVQNLADAFSTAYARYEDFNNLETAKGQIEKTLVDLKLAQAQLVQSEKMASLGELTAGIAHEIQNPLNFVNNFSEVNAELIDELNNELAIGNMQLAKEIADNIKGNEEKIIFHGKRADAIVKGMLQHSRSSSGVKEPTDINALADEYLRLAYHGLRAKDKSFNATMKTDYDPAIGMINIIPQDIGRVILNLITNAFYAVSEKNKQQPENYQPTVKVVTEKIGDKIEIRVSDNGNGIPQSALDKIFQPFFTTKPTGQGTGLGLSLSYDIVKAHGGVLQVETTEGENAEFIIHLPVT